LGGVSRAKSNYLAIFRALSKKFSGKIGSAPLEKIGPYAYEGKTPLPHCTGYGPKKLHTAFFAITLPTLNHFS